MLPIELVFADIQEYLKATRNVEISNPQTWLGGAAVNDNVEGPSKIGALRNDNQPLGIQEPTQIESAQEEPNVPAVEGLSKIEAPRKDNSPLDAQEPIQSEDPPKQPDVSVENLGHSTSQSSISRTPSVLEDQPSKPHRRVSTSSTPPPLWSASKEPPPQENESQEEAKGASLPDRESLPTLLQRVPISGLPRISKTSAIHVNDAVGATEQNSTSDLRATMPEVPQEGTEDIKLGSLYGHPVHKGEMSSKLDAKQDENKISPEKLPTNKKLPEPHDLEPEDSGVARRHDTFSSAASADDSDDRDSLHRHYALTLNWTEIDDLLTLSQLRQGARAAQISRDILTEVVIFDDLMRHILGLPSTDQRIFAWFSGSGPLLMSKVGPAKTELIFQILAEEVRLIRVVLKHEVRPTSSLKAPYTLS